MKRVTDFVDRAHTLTLKRANKAKTLPTRESGRGTSETILNLTVTTTILRRTHRPIKR